MVCCGEKSWSVVVFGAQNWIGPARVAGLPPKRRSVCIPIAQRVGCEIMSSRLLLALLRILLRRPQLSTRASLNFLLRFANLAPHTDSTHSLIAWRANTDGAAATSQVRSSVSDVSSGAHNHNTHRYGAVLNAASGVATRPSPSHREPPMQPGPRALVGALKF